jgi:hypothetical protein
MTTETTVEPAAPASRPTKNRACVVFPHTELGNAGRFALRHEADVRPGRPLEESLVRDGKRVKPDDYVQVLRCMVHAVRNVRREAATSMGEAEEKRKDWAERSESARSMRASLSFAESLSGLPTIRTALDSDGWLLKVRNGSLAPAAPTGPVPWPAVD